MTRALLLIALLGPAACGGGGGDAAPTGPAVPVKVMTRNLYLGANLLPVVTAPTADDVPVRVGELWQSQMDNDIRARLQLVADEIVAANPDLVGLQEVETFYRQQPSDFSFADPKKDATDVAVDFLAELLADLAARGAHYRDVAITHNVDVELPAGPADARFDVRMADRDVILAREGVDVGAATVTNYKSMLTFPIPITGTPSAPVTLLRGLARVPVTVNGARFTFANTHLEIGGDPTASSQVGTILKNLQEAQAGDLLREMSGVSGPVVLVGDFNSPADRSGTASYGAIAARFDDAGGRRGRERRPDLLHGRPARAVRRQAAARPRVPARGRAPRRPRRGRRDGAHAGRAARVGSPGRGRDGHGAAAVAAWRCSARYLRGGMPTTRWNCALRYSMCA